MSLKTFITDIKSLAGKIESDLRKFFGNATKWEDIAQAGLTVVGGILSNVVTLEGGPVAGAAIAAVVARLQADIVAAKALTTTIGATPTVTGVLTSIATDVSQIESTFNITNPASKAQLATALETIQTIVSAAPAVAAVVETAASVEAPVPEVPAPAAPQIELVSTSASNQVEPEPPSIAVDDTIPVQPVAPKIGM